VVRKGWTSKATNSRFAISIAEESADLVEGAAEVGVAEGPVLVELEAVLVIEVERPEFAEAHGEVDFIGRVESGEDAVGGFDESADGVRVRGFVGEVRGRVRWWDIGMVHRSFGLGSMAMRTFLSWASILSRASRSQSTQRGHLWLRGCRSLHRSEPQDDEVGVQESTRSMQRRDRWRAYWRHFLSLLVKARRWSWG